jgi:hypothetical protein
MADHTKADDAGRTTEIDLDQALPPANNLTPALQSGGLPVPRTAALPALKKSPRKRWWPRIAIAAAILIGAGGGGYYWWQHLRAQLPPGIAYGNGRLEADAINIDTKYAGRIAELFADEGDFVKGGQMVARMDTQDLAALALFPAILLAVAVVREKELGSITNLYVTPVRRIEFLLGKQVPYIGLAMINFFTNVPDGLVRVSGAAQGLLPHASLRRAVVRHDDDVLGDVDFGVCQHPDRRRVRHGRARGRCPKTPWPKRFA